MANQPTKYKKFLAGAASATLVATAIVPTALAAEVEKAATDFSDVAATHTHYAAIMQAVERGLFDGYTDGTFKPENSIDRKGVAKSLAKYVVSQSEYKTFEEYITANKLADKVTPFNDVPATHGDAELFNASLIVKDAGIFTGSNNNLMPGNVITRQQMAKVLVNGFGLKDLAGVESEVTDTDKAQAEYVNFINILSENNVTEVTTFNPTGAVKRGQMASFLNRSFDSAHQVVAPETATKVVSVSATNLKEVVVTFDGSVDKATAGDADYYSIVDGSNVDQAIKTATVSDDLKSVTLTLDTAVELDNQEEHELNFDNVKAGDKVLSLKDYAFTPVDASLPVANTVTALGNKTVKIQFSEPIDVANASHFLIDGNTVVGSTDIVGNTVILRTYSTLSNGEHKVEVKGVEDFAGFKSLTKEFTFNVVEDVTAPTISSVENATFEKVTVKFSEAIDPSTVNPTTFYWLDGTTKKYANKVTPVTDDTFLIEFSTENKFVYPTNLYVAGARDYSGNAIAADSKIQVTPVIDQTRPEVASAALNDARNEITVKFNKVLNEESAEKAANYVVKDSDGKEVSKLKTVTLGSDGKTVTVSLVTALSQGKTYSLDVTGVSDNTTLKNVMMPYSKSLVVGDKTGPAIANVNVTSNHNVATGANSIYVNFPEVMAVSGDGSIVEKAKYMYFDGSWKALPSGARINVTPDGKSAVITFPTNVPVNAVTELRVQLVKDAAGNYMQPLTEDFDVSPAVNAVLQSVEATATNKVVLTFNQNILANTVTASDFTVNANGNKLNVLTAEATDDQEITLTLADNSKLNQNATFGANSTVTVDIKDTNVSTVTSAGKPVVDATVAGADAAKDKIKATLKGIVGGNTIAVQFNELLDEASDASAENDFIVRNQNGSIIPTSAYSVAVNEVGGVGTDTVTISFNSAQSGVYTVELANPRYLEDAQDNKVAAFEATQVVVGTNPVGALVVAQGNAGNTATPSQAEVEAAAGETLTLGNPTGANDVLVTLSQNNSDTLSVTSANATSLNIALADTTIANNNATAIQSAIRALGGSFANWTAVGSATWNTATTGDTLTNATDTTSGGTAAVAGTTESADFTVTTASSKTGNITVTVNGVNHTVAVTNGQTATQVASAIATKLTADTVTGYTVSNPSDGVVRFVSTTANTNVTPDITVTIN